MTLPSAAEIDLEDRPKLSLRSLSELCDSIEALRVEHAHEEGWDISRTF